MLAKEFRLTGAKNFERVQRKGKVFQSDSFGLAYLKKEGGPSNFGFVVSNKISRRSTERNRIKRALREAVRLSLKQIEGDMDIVFLAKQKIVQRKGDEILEEVTTALRNAGLTK